MPEPMDALRNVGSESYRDDHSVEEPIRPSYRSDHHADRFQTNQYEIEHARHEDHAALTTKTTTIGTSEWTRTAAIAIVRQPLG